MRRFAALGLAAVLSALLMAVGAASSGGGGVKTAKRPYLVPTPEGLAMGVETDPILSTGDVVGGYQMSGIPDGLGGYKGHRGRGKEMHANHDRGHANGHTFSVVMNHELGKTFPGQPPGVDTRISKLTIDRKSNSVLSGTYLFTGAEGFERFCSSTLRVVHGTPFYFTGEEAIDAGHDGSSIAMNARTGQWWETKHFGHLQHENVVPLQLGGNWVFLTSEDDFRITPVRHSSYLYAYIAHSFRGGVKGTEGSLSVFVPDDPAETGNATVVKGEEVKGHFVPISQAENATNVTLKNAANTRGAFKFDRLEDIAVHGHHQSRVYIADTGKPPTSDRGRIYQFDFNHRDPSKATLKMILNGDAPDNDLIFNPDNMAASERVLVIQEDRESQFRDDWNYVLTYNFETKKLTRVARVDTTPPLRKGQWESSGVIDARKLLGRDWWLVDVQAHSQLEKQPGAAAPGVQPPPNLTTPNGEDGQLLALKIPGSTGGGKGHHRK